MSSSESEDENLKKFAESVDNSVFSNNLYQKDTKDKKVEPKVELKSQRHIEADENIFKSEINVSSSMQVFIGKKLSKLIEDQVDFVEVKPVAEEEDPVDNVRLLSGTKEVVKHIFDPTVQGDRKKIPIKRRKVESDLDPHESTKISNSAVEVSEIESEVKTWSKKSRHQPIEYKNIKGTGYIREPENEFTKIRRKNNWDESKIKLGKYHNPPMCDLIKR